MAKKQFFRLTIECFVAIALLSFFLSHPVFFGEIHKASEIGNLEMVKTLIKNNPELVASKDERGITPLYQAALNGHKNVVEFLIEHGSNVHERLKNGMTALSAAASKYKDVVVLLIDKGTDVTTENYRGSTALHHAAYFRNREIAELLLNKGADVNAVSICQL